jgi:hypothetical protein
MHRWRRPALFACALIAVAAFVGGRLARAIERRAEAAVRRAGVTAGSVHFSWLGPLRLDDVAASAPGGGRLTIDTVGLRWRLFGGRGAHTHLSGLTLRGLRLERAPLSATWPEAAFDLVAVRSDDGVSHVALHQRSGDGEIEAQWPKGGAQETVQLSRLDLVGADVKWNGATVLNPGRWSGHATFVGSAAHFASDGALHGDGVRLTPPREMESDGGTGSPTAMNVEWQLHGDGDAVEIGRFAARLSGLDVSAHGVIKSAPDRQVDMSLEAHCDLADAFHTAGLTLPLQGRRVERLGAASLDLAMRGPLAQPAALVVAPRLRFDPEPDVASTLSYLRRPFVYRPDESPGVVVDVREGAPDFISIDAVSARFQRALLISEDAGFPRHCGIDLTEIAAAWAENEEEGRRLRGASTITQQLVKNLFLSGERTYGRKLKEAALALMVDAVVPKARLLEIYVNVIEWGPRLHGLVPAARHYFGKRPAELSAKETAFLVCLIPNPVRYHQAHEAGRLGPGMEQLVRNLLGKLHSLGELDDDEYQQALDEELQFAPEAAAPPYVSATTASAVARSGSSSFIR